MALLICALTVPGFGDMGSGKAQSCSDIRQFYNGNGFSLKGVPQSEISGRLVYLCHCNDEFTLFVYEIYESCNAPDHLSISIYGLLKYLSEKNDVPITEPQTSLPLKID